VKKKRIRLVRDFALMIIGATLTSIAAKYIFDPADLVTGGVTGLAIIIRSLSERYLGHVIPLWLSTFILNIPIFLYALKVSGLRRILRTGFVWLLITAELYWLPPVAFMPEDRILAVIFGSVLTGLGSGLLLTAHATSGGSDMLGESLHHRLRSVSVGRLIQIIDGLVVTGGLLTFGIEKTLYAVLAVWLMGRIVDIVLDRGKHARMATIVSSESEAIAGEIMRQLDRGVTSLKGEGMFTGTDKKVLMCVCSNRELVAVQDIVKRIDPKAFFVVGDVAEVRGEGFIEEWA